MRIEITVDERDIVNSNIYPEENERVDLLKAINTLVAVARSYVETYWDDKDKETTLEELKALLGTPTKRVLQS